MEDREERNRILGRCENQVGVASSIAGMTMYGAGESLLNCVGVPWWPAAAVGVGAASYVCGGVGAAMVNSHFYPEDRGVIVAAQLPAAMRRDVDHDRMLLRYVRGLHTGNVQSLHGGRLVTTQTTPRNFPRHILESIERRVHPEAIRQVEDELVRQSASGGGKEDD